MKSHGSGVASIPALPGSGARRLSRTQSMVIAGNAQDTSLALTSADNVPVGLERAEPPARAVRPAAGGVGTLSFIADPGLDCSRWRPGKPQAGPASPWEEERRELLILGG